MSRLPPDLGSQIGSDDAAQVLQTAMWERVDRLMLPPPPERKRLRVDADLTVDEMARLCAVNKETFRQWELGRRRPHQANRIMYAAVLQRLAHHELGG